MPSDTATLMLMKYRIETQKNRQQASITIFGDKIPENVQEKKTFMEQLWIHGFKRMEAQCHNNSIIAKQHKQQQQN